jgi:hypothetical protein
MIISGPVRRHGPEAGRVVFLSVHGDHAMLHLLNRLMGFPATMQRLILEILGPRMGSTNLSRHLEAFEKVEALGEFFNPGYPLPEDLVADVSDAMAAQGLPRAGSRRRQAEIAQAHPLEAVDAAIGVCLERGTPHPVLKLAPGHLSGPDTARLVRRFRPYGIVLHRAPIDQFISRKKALSLRTWRSVDTTAIRPTLDPKAFRAWRWRQENHLRLGTYLLRKHGHSSLIFRYEEIYADPTRIGDLLARSFGEAGLDLGRRGEVDELPRQDKAATRDDKVSNWDAFKADMGTGRTVDMESYDVEGSPLPSNAQLLLERVLPKSTLQGVARQLGLSGMPTYKAEGRKGAKARAGADG